MSFDEKIEKLKTPCLSSVKSVSVEKWIAYGMFALLIFIPLFSSMYSQLVFGKFISYMIFALALDILWGYAGLMNLGFALFFGLGGYVLGISLSCQNGLPAFMEFGGLTQIPLLYKPLQNIPFAFLMGLFEFLRCQRQCRGIQCHSVYLVYDLEWKFFYFKRPRPLRHG